jgi:uncharacterized membrane protein YeaQ/YmgE (transglycosylase-associated protein family)
MTLHAMTVVLAGLVAGYLADLVMKGRGYGMMGDVLLGIGGSLAGGALFNVLAFAPGREWLPTVAAAFAGAVVLIVVQRVFWRART